MPSQRNNCCDLRPATEDVETALQRFRIMKSTVLEELKIIKEELEGRGVTVPLSELKEWTIQDRAYAEQWALKVEGVELPEVAKPYAHTIITSVPVN